MIMIKKNIIVVQLYNSPSQVTIFFQGFKNSKDNPPQYTITDKHRIGNQVIPANGYQKCFIQLKINYENPAKGPPNTFFLKNAENY